MLTNLEGFGGNIYLVNAKYESIGERRCFSSLDSLPENPDCVAVVAPRDAVEEIVLQAARLKVGGVILYASGYAETRLPERIALQRRLGAIALESGLKILGPNCLGIANYLRRARISFSDYPAPREMSGKSIGIASQSGALSQSLAQAVECGAAISHAFSAGNQADVDVADLVSYLADEPSCHAIACVFEGMALSAATARSRAHCLAQQQASVDQQDGHRHPGCRGRDFTHRQHRGRLTARTAPHSNAAARSWSKSLKG